MKKIPPEMREWYFPFNWDLSSLWALDVPTETHHISELRWHFDIPIWSVAKGMHFDLCPAEVIQNPGRHPRHDDRIEKTDISYPIDMMFTVDRYAIIDGIHRLAKYEKQGLTDVQVRIIPREMIPKIRYSEIIRILKGVMPQYNTLTPFPDPFSLQHTDPFSSL